MERPVDSSSELGGWGGPGPPAACLSTAEKEPSTLSGSVLGALPTHLGHSPKPAPFTSLGYRRLGGESRSEKSKCGLTLRVSTGSGLPGSWSLWQPACRAIPPPRRPRRWLPGTQRGRWHCSLRSTKVGPDQGGAGSAATPARKQGDLAQCLHPHTPPGEAVAEPRGGGPGLQLQEAGNRHLPHQASWIIRKKPQGLHLTLIMVEGRRGPKPAPSQPECTQLLTGELPAHRPTCQKPLLVAQTPCPRAGLGVRMFSVWGCCGDSSDRFVRLEGNSKVTCEC